MKILRTIPLFIAKALANKPLVIYGDGEQTRDFIYVANVVEANLLACQCKSIVGESFNIGSGMAISLHQMISALQKVIESDIKLEYAAARSGDIRHSQADIKKAKYKLGYQIKVTFIDGLLRTVKWLKENR